MTQSQQETAANSSFIMSVAPLVAGIAGGAVSTILLHPLDLVKVRLQVNEEASAWFGPKQQLSNAIRRRGLVSTMKGIIRYEGIVSLYNGLSPGLLASSISWGGYFFFYETFKNQLLELQKPNMERLGAFQTFSASCAASTVMIALTNPLWLVKTRMQLQVVRIKPSSTQLPSVPPLPTTNASVSEHSFLQNQRQYTGIVNAFQTIIKEEGFTALYKGVVPALMLTSLGGIQIVTYEFLKYHFGSYTTSKRATAGARTVTERFYDSLGYLSMGALSKIVASTCTYPVQVIKTRLQQRSHTLEISPDTGKLQVVHREYTAGIFDCIHRIWIREGIAGFFKGCIPNAIRVAPNAAITFVTYESMMDIILGFENRR